MAWAIWAALMPVRPTFLAASWMVSWARLTATQEAGAASEMPCAAPPTRVYPAGTATAELGAAGLAVTLADTVAAADFVAGTADFAGAGALLQEAMATPMTMAAGTATRWTPMCTIAAFLG